MQFIISACHPFRSRAVCRSASYLLAVRPCFHLGQTSQNAKDLCHFVCSHLALLLYHHLLATNLCCPYCQQLAVVEGFQCSLVEEVVAAEC